MRGQFSTPGSMRLLTLALASAVVFCHPIKNRLYVSMLFAALAAVFAFASAAVDEAWIDCARMTCVVCYLITLAVQQSRVNREAEKRRQDAADGSKKHSRARK